MHYPCKNSWWVIKSLNLQVSLLTNQFMRAKISQNELTWSCKLLTLQYIKSDYFHKEIWNAWPKWKLVEIPEISLFLFKNIKMIFPLIIRKLVYFISLYRVGDMDMMSEMGNVDDDEMESKIYRKATTKLTYSDDSLSSDIEEEQEEVQSVVSEINLKRSKEKNKKSNLKAKSKVTFSPRPSSRHQEQSYFGSKGGRSWNRRQSTFRQSKQSFQHRSQLDNEVYKRQAHRMYQQKQQGTPHKQQLQTEDLPVCMPISSQFISTTRFLLLTIAAYKLTDIIAHYGIVGKLVAEISNINLILANNPRLLNLCIVYRE